VSPTPARVAQARRHRAQWISVIVVLVISIGALAGTLAAKWSPRLGLDLAGGLSVTYQTAHKVSQSDLNQTVDILNSRVNQVGVSGAQVSTQGSNQIVVSIPGISNGRAVLKQLGQPSQLYFRPGLCYAPPYSGGSKHSNKAAATNPSLLPSSCPASSQLTKSNLNPTSSGSTSDVPPDTSLAAYPSTKPPYDDPGSTVLLPGAPGSGSNQGGERYLLGKAQLTGHAVASAVAQQEQSGQWVVNYTLTSSGSPKWDQVAQENFHQIVAIELDGLVYSAPVIQPAQSSFTSFNGQGEISGNLTEGTAKDLAQAINFGALPVRLIQLQTQTISPTLGKSSLQAGLWAGLAGLVLVLLYTIVYYRALGIVAVSGLAVTAALLWAIVSSLGHTSVAPSFDLAGVTGVIVSIGITVDSYIVYFERLKDEARTGRTVRTSVDRGFKNAFRTVLAADFVSLIAAILLFLLATSDVKGFAFFLGLSTLLDIFMTYFFTRPLVAILGRNEQVTQARFIGISRGVGAVQPGEVGA
jgi:preprotein translocase subunit SecD